MSKKPPNRGEEHLVGLESVSILLENNAYVEMDARDELSIPEGVDEIYEAATNAPAKYAFWAYQTERALAKVRSLETSLQEAEGQTYTAHRLALRRDGAFVGEASIKAEVDSDAGLVAARQELDNLRFTYGMLRSIRDAVANRTQILLRLLDQAKPSP